MNTTTLISARELPDGTYTLTWNADLAIAAVAAALLEHATVTVTYHPGTDTGKDPLTVLEEDLSGETITDTATMIATAAAVTATTTLHALTTGTPVTVTSDQLWDLATAANGEYVRYRRADLEHAGTLNPPGQPGHVDVERALADLLGTHAQPQQDRSAPWGAEAALFATLNAETLDILLGSTPAR